MTSWVEALRIGQLFALDPPGTGGIVVRAAAGPVRDRFMAALATLLPAGGPTRRMPVGIADDRLLGGLDLAATLGSGRPVASRGLLAEADGGVLVVAMAERLSAATTGRIAAAIDTGRVAAERDGLAIRAAARFGVVALDEGDADEQPPAALLDRLGFRVALEGISWRELQDGEPGSDGIARQTALARARCPEVAIAPELLDALSAAAAGLGVASFRAVLLAARTACALAALAGRDHVLEEDAAEAARLVLAPRATALPPAPPDDPQPTPDTGEATQDDAAGELDERPDADPLETVLAAAKAAIPTDLLARLAAGVPQRSRSAGRVGGAALTGLRGRPAGSRPGRPRDGARLDVLETLRAAAPMQRLRGATPGRVAVRAADFRIVRRVQRARTTTIFVVDASGSSALHRLAEAKGAVELLLAECYVRRDRVALLAFRGRAAELVLPPTCSLTRARRGLAGLPGGGGTPLASGLDGAAGLADAVRRQDGRAVVVLLTDGRANVARDGVGDRGRAAQEALVAAGVLRDQRVPCLLIDTSPRPAAAARALADAMGATYLPLPHADAGAMARAVRAAAA